MSKYRCLAAMKGSPGRKERQKWTAVPITFQSAGANSCIAMQVSAYAALHHQTKLTLS